MNEYVIKEVHHLYYDKDENCARTTLRCLSNLFSFPVGEDVLSSAIGMHGAGFYRAQCGLVEGSLMFIGLYGTAKAQKKMRLKSCVLISHQLLRKSSHP